LPDITLPFPQVGKDDETTIQNLYDTVIKLRKELEFIMYNLDEKNVLKAKSVIADWVYAGIVEANKITTVNAKITNAQIDSLEANKITTVNAKIGTAQIETLTVGGNVAMGSNAYISWANVTSQPFIPSQYTDSAALAAWVASGYKTYIDGNGIYTGTLTANQINAISGIALGAGASINFNLVTPPTASQVGARASNWVPSKSDLGTWTTYIDANGIYTGTLTGNTIQTGVVNTARIVMSSSGIKGYDSINRKHGLYIDKDYADLTLCYQDTDVFKLLNAIDGCSLQCMGHTNLAMSHQYNTAYYTWDFSNATVSGLTAVWG
jgi:hypothetical protein